MNENRVVPSVSQTKSTIRSQKSCAPGRVGWCSRRWRRSLRLSWRAMPTSNCRTGAGGSCVLVKIPRSPDPDRDRAGRGYEAEGGRSRGDDGA
jgi:hypothetical protein